MKKINVVFYTRKLGSVPMNDFLNGLDFEDREKVETEIDGIKNNDIDYLISRSKHLKNAGGLFEFRIKCKQLAVRLMYYYGEANDIIITHGIIKRTKQTPEKEKRIAKRYYNDWRSRGGLMQNS